MKRLTVAGQTSLSTVSATALTLNSGSNMGLTYPSGSSITDVSGFLSIQAFGAICINCGFGGVMLGQLGVPVTLGAGGSDRAGTSAVGVPGTISASSIRFPANNTVTACSTSDDIGKYYDSPNRRALARCRAVGVLDLGVSASIPISASQL